MNWEPTADEIERKLIAMAYAWGEVEEAIAAKYPGLAASIGHAFRIETYYDLNGWGDPCVWYRLLFDVTDAEARKAARSLEDNRMVLAMPIHEIAKPWHGKDFLSIDAVAHGTPVVGQLCRRPGEEHPSDRSPTLDDVPTTTGSNTSVGRMERDGYWLTPIEVPFYDALRETGLTFAVQPWIQGTDRKYRVDFLVFYGGNCIAVELDGHEWHKSRQQRAGDAARDRWFAERKIQTLRWTGSQVHRDPHACVGELLNVLRGAGARP